MKSTESIGDRRDQEEIVNATLNEYLQRATSRRGHPERCCKYRSGERRGLYWDLLTRDPDTGKFSRTFAGKRLFVTAGGLRTKRSRLTLARHLVKCEARTVFTGVSGQGVRRGLISHPTQVAAGCLQVDAFVEIKFAQSGREIASARALESIRDSVRTGELPPKSHSNSIGRRMW